MDTNTPTNYEYIACKDGSTYILAGARVSHSINGKIISGCVVGENGPTKEHKVLEYSNVKTHRCMDWSNQDNTLVINETRWPSSMR